MQLRLIVYHTLFFLHRQAIGAVKDNGWDVKRPQAFADSKPAVPAPVGWRLSCSMGRTFWLPIVQCLTYNLEANATGSLAKDKLLLP